MQRAIFGAGGCGRGVLPLARMSARPSDKKIVFVDDGLAGTEINGHQVLSFEEFISTGPQNKSVCVAIANGEIRKNIVSKCIEFQLPFFEVRSPDVIAMDDVEIGVGAIISPGAVLTSNIRIGAHFHCNIQSYVEHDCVIGDYVTFAPGVRCNGNVHIGDGAYIGSGAIIRQGTPANPLRIGAGAVVGMGAVVLNDVPSAQIVVGNPARMLKSK